MDCSAAAHYGPLVRADVRWWSARDAAARVADPAVLDELLEQAALVVDLRGCDTGPPRGFEALRRAPCPVIGVADADPTAWPLDLALVTGAPDTHLLGGDVEEAAAVLTTAAATSPAAAGVLAQVLRATPSLPVAAALSVESLAYSLLLGGPEFRAWLSRRPQPRAAAAHAGPPVVSGRDGDCLRVTLNRPHVHNAYDAGMRDALVAVLEVAAADPSVRRIVLDGNGPSFCSGGDLSEFGTAVDLVHAHAVRTTRSAGALLHLLRDRVEVRVHGACIGAGVELAAFASRVRADRDATFRLPEVAMGALPGAGGTVSLPRRVGASRSLLLALSGISLTAADALRWGLVDEVTG